MNINDFNPFPFLKEGAFSLLSDGKLSLKRLLALLFAVAVLYMIKLLCTTVIPKENTVLFSHCFDGLLIVICVLTGAATIKDLVALKFGNDKKESNDNSGNINVAQKDS